MTAPLLNATGVGLLLSLALGEVLAGMLYQVSFADPIVFFGDPATAGARLAPSLLRSRKPGRANPADGGAA